MRKQRWRRADLLLIGDRSARRDGTRRGRRLDVDLLRDDQERQGDFEPAGAGALLLWGCTIPIRFRVHRRPMLAEGAPACTASVGQADLVCAAPPSTFATADLSTNCVSAISGPCLGQAWDAWAWSSFAALNWPALASSDAANYPSGFVRGVPDTSKAFLTAQSTDVSVWETFKEKRELFNPAALPGAWQQLTFDPKYAPEFSGGQIQMCASADAVNGAGKSIPEFCPHIPPTGTPQHRRRNRRVASPAQESTTTFALVSPARPSDRAFCETPLPPQVPARTPSPTPLRPNGRNPVGRGFSKASRRRIISFITRSRSTTTITLRCPPITVNGQTTSLNTYAARCTGVEESHRASRPHQRRVGARQNPAVLNSAATPHLQT